MCIKWNVVCRLYPAGVMESGVNSGQVIISSWRNTHLLTSVVSLESQINLTCTSLWEKHTVKRGTCEFLTQCGWFKPMSLKISKLLLKSQTQETLSHFWSNIFQGDLTADRKLHWRAEKLQYLVCYKPREWFKVIFRKTTF